jgi:CHAT domain-containing protein/tetratricopeptide (TPR) repeat protein
VRKVYLIFLLVFLAHNLAFSNAIKLELLNDLINSGEFDQAENLIQNYLTSSLTPETKVDLLLKLALINWNKGNLEAYQKNSVAALSLAEKIKNSRFIFLAENYLKILSLYNEGKSLAARGSFQDSLKAFNEAINISQIIRSPHHELKCRRLLSITYWQLKDYVNFLNENKLALDLAYKLNHKREQGRCLNNMGLAFWKLDNYTEALNCFLSALQIARELHNYQDESDILANIAPVYRDLGHFDLALEYISASLDIDKKLSNERGIWSNKINLGSVLRQKYLATGDKNYLLEAIKIYKSLLANEPRLDLDIKVKILNNLSCTFNDLGDFYSSLQCLNQAIEIARQIKDREEESLIYTNIGIVNYNLGNYEQAIEFYKKSIDLASRLRNGNSLWEAYLELANAYKKKGQVELAILNYKNSIDIIENIRSKLALEEYRAGFLGSDKRLDSYYKLIDLLIKTSHHNDRLLKEAFNFYERAKARAFLDSIEISKIALNESVDQKLRYREMEIMTEISNLYTKLLNPELTEDLRKQILEQLDATEQELEAVRREMRASNPAYANLQYPQFITVDQAQKKFIPQDTVVIAYLLTSENSYAFALTRKSLKVFSLPPAREIRERIKSYLGLLCDPAARDFSAGYELFRLLVEPALTAGIKRILIIPDDILHFFPFETLRRQNRGRSVWLIEDYSFSYVPSLTSLKELKERKDRNAFSRKQFLLAIGQPTFELNGNGFNSETQIVLKSFYEPGFNLILDKLQFSLQEIETIASYFPAKKRKILAFQEASEEKLKATDLSQYQIIHFATHCIIDDKKPARTSIVLRLDQDPQEDGLLQVREIFNLRLKADLVTLSACQTGSGAFIKGEGIDGLNRAFFYAGASSLLLSLWSVNDQATAQLMARFYYHLKAHRSIERALQKTKLELINSDVLSHPYYWAGFIAHGDTNKIIFRHNNYYFLLPSLAIFALIFSVMIKIRNGKKSFKKF